MSKAKTAAVISSLIWFISVLTLAFAGAIWTEATLMRLSVPEIKGFGNYAEDITLEIYDINEELIYKRYFSYGKRLTDDDNITFASKVIELSRSKKIFEDYPWWYDIFFKLEGVDPYTLEGYLTDLYSENLVKLSGYEGVKKDLLKFHTIKKLKKTYSDRELYAMYLDSAHFEQNVHGIKGASYAYFSKDYNDLAVKEQLYLINRILEPEIIQNDEELNVFLKKLYQSNIIDNETYHSEINQKLTLSPPVFTAKEPFITDYILKNIYKEYPDIKKNDKNVKIYTYYNLEAAKAAREALAKTLNKDPKLQAAFILVNAKTRGIEAVIGDRNEKSYRNRAFTSKRQMGSTFKPIVFAAAFSKGMLPCEIITDKRYTFIQGKQKYSPNNYKGYFKGRIPARHALVYSLNNAAVLVAKRTGLSYVVSTAKKVGFKGEIKPYLAMALGSFPTTPINVAEIYTTIANYGYRGDLAIIKKVTVNEEELERKVTPVKSAIDEASAYQTMYIMQAVASHGTARGKKLIPGTAAKTGTTDKGADFWTVAITPPYVTVLWLGYDDNSPVNNSISAGEIAVPIVASFQHKFFKDIDKFDIPAPDTILFRRVNPKTGKLSSAPGSYIEAFKKDNLPPKK